MAWLGKVTHNLILGFDPACQIGALAHFHLKVRTVSEAAAARASLHTRRESYGQGSYCQVEHLRQHVEWLKVQIKQVEREIEDHIACHPKLKRDSDLLASIPGVGKATIAVMLGHVGDMQRFDSAKAWAAHLGVSPRQRTSGTSIRGRTSMCRTGSRTTRSALYMPAVVASRHNPVLKNFAERLQANGLPKKAVIGAFMRKLVHLMFAVVRSGIAFQPDYPRSRQMS